jgi:hypothetical protein
VGNAFDDQAKKKGTAGVRLQESPGAQFLKGIFVANIANGYQQLMQGSPRCVADMKGQ